MKTSSTHDQKMFKNVCEHLLMIRSISENKLFTSIRKHLLRMFVRLQVGKHLSLIRFSFANVVTANFLLMYRPLPDHWEMFTNICKHILIVLDVFIKNLLSLQTFANIRKCFAQLVDTWFILASIYSRRHILNKCSQAFANVC